MKKLVFISFLFSIFLYWGCNCEKIVQSYKKGDYIQVGQDEYGIVVRTSDWRNNYLLIVGDSCKLLLNVDYLNSINLPE